ncbi:TPA: macro domain-containing protein [Salmonella enterica subsp. enterica serovar Reading]
MDAASRRLHHGGGCGAIHKATGPELLVACKNHIRSHGNLPAGEVILTPPGKVTLPWCYPRGRSPLAVRGVCQTSGWSACAGIFPVTEACPGQWLS